MKRVKKESGNILIIEREDISDFDLNRGSLTAPLLFIFNGVKRGEKMRKVKDKRDYKRARVLSGHGPHKILNKLIKERIHNEGENIPIMSINYFKWKGLDEDSEGKKR